MRSFSRWLAVLLIVSGCAMGSSHAESSVTDDAVELTQLSILYFPKETGRKHIVTPQWSRTPSSQLIRNVFPATGEMTIFAEIVCSVANDRSLENCRFDSIDPAGPRFEEIFLRLAGEYRLAEDSPAPKDISVVTIAMLLKHPDAGRIPCYPAFCFDHSKVPSPDELKDD